MIWVWAVAVTLGIVVAGILLKLLIYVALAWLLDEPTEHMK